MELNVPGVIRILVVPVTAQLKVLFVPKARLVGSALNDVIAGAEPVPEDEPDEAFEPHPSRPVQANKITTIAQRSSSKRERFRELRPFLQGELAESM